VTPGDGLSGRVEPVAALPGTVIPGARTNHGYSPAAGATKNRSVRPSVAAIESRIE
jgi:hypothetical protein